MTLFEVFPEAAKLAAQTQEPVVITYTYQADAPASGYACSLERLNDSDANVIDRISQGDKKMLRDAQTDGAAIGHYEETQNMKRLEVEYDAVHEISRELGKGHSGMTHTLEQARLDGIKTGLRFAMEKIRDTNPHFKY